MSAGTGKVAFIAKRDGKLTLMAIISAMYLSRYQPASESTEIQNTFAAGISNITAIWTSGRNYYSGEQPLPDPKLRRKTVKIAEEAMGQRDNMRFSISSLMRLSEDEQ